MSIKAVLFDIRILIEDAHESDIDIILSAANGYILWLILISWMDLISHYNDSCHLLSNKRLNNSRHHHYCCNVQKKKLQFFKEINELSCHSICWSLKSNPIGFGSNTPSDSYYPGQLLTFYHTILEKLGNIVYINHWRKHSSIWETMCLKRGWNRSRWSYTRFMILVYNKHSIN